MSKFITIYHNVSNVSHYFLAPTRSPNEKRDKEIKEKKIRGKQKFAKKLVANVCKSWAFFVNEKSDMFQNYHLDPILKAQANLPSLPEERDFLLRPLHRHGAARHVEAKGLADDLVPEADREEPSA